MIYKKFIFLFSFILFSGSFLSAEASQLDSIKNSEVLKVAVDNGLKFLSYKDSRSGEYKGLEPTLARMIAKEIYEDVEVDFIPLTASNREKLIENDDADLIIGSYTITDERKKKYDISAPYFITNVSVLVNKISNITKVEDLLGKTVGVIKNSTSAKDLVRYLVSKDLIDKESFNENEFSTIEWNNKISFFIYDTHKQAVAAMEKDEIQGYCVDDVILNSFLNNETRLIEDSFSPQEYGIVSKKGSDLSVFVDELIQKWKDDGTLDEIIEENRNN